MIGVSNDENYFPHEPLLTNRQVGSLCKTFANNSSADFKLSKTQFSRIIQSEEFLGRIFGPLLKTGLPLMKNVVKSLAKSVLIRLGLTVPASAADAGIHKKILGFSSTTTTVIISNDEMEDIIKIVKSLEDFSLLLKGVNETIQNDTKEQKKDFLVCY